MIESVNNEKIKEISKLKERKYQNLNKMYLVEGEHLVSEAAKKGVLVSVFALCGTDYNYDNITFVSEAVMKKITSLTTIPSIVGVAKFADVIPTSGDVLILDRIQDPGNMGTIMRSALAFNINTLYISPGSVSIYNPKVVRASEGAIFHLNFILLDLSIAIEELKQKGYKVYTTDVRNGKSLRNFSFADNSAIIIGNEGVGVDKKLNELSDDAIYIETGVNTESLNASVATSIILYELNCKRQNKI